MITQKIKQKIKELSLQTENEICGFVTSNGLYACANPSSIAPKHFFIKPEDYLKASYKGKIEFVYHSHNKNPEFSDFDKLNLYNHKLKGLLYCKTADNFNVFLPESYNNKYVGREFKIGVSDCLSLITEYYRNELGIELPKIERTEGWYERNPEMVNENIPAFLNKISPGDIQEKNIIVFDMLSNGKPSHFGIYLGNNAFLHHPRHKLSTIELLDGWKEKICFGLRCN